MNTQKEVYMFYVNLQCAKYDCTLSGKKNYCKKCGEPTPSWFKAVIKDPIYIVKDNLFLMPDYRWRPLSPKTLIFHDKTKAEKVLKELNDTDAQILEGKQVYHFFKDTSSIVKFIVNILDTFDIPSKVTHSQFPGSDSIYIKFNLKDRNHCTEPITIRVSNHSVPRYKENINCDYDVFASYYREDAKSYIQVLYNIATRCNKRLPQYFLFIAPGTANYKKYLFDMHRNI